MRGSISDTDESHITFQNIIIFIILIFHYWEQFGCKATGKPITQNPIWKLLQIYSFHTSFQYFIIHKHFIFQRFQLYQLSH